jgi:hypothetical protein
MNNYYDFYDEPSEFEMQIEEFKDGLRKAVKQEYLTKIERLEKELAELKDLKENWNSKLAELEEAKRETERVKSEAMREARGLRLSELFADNFLTAWGIAYEWKYINEKCDKCDDKGYIHFFSPQGKEMTEPCCCREKKLVHTLTEAKVVKITSNNKSIGKTVRVYYRYNRYESKYYNEDEDRFEEVTQLADDMKFEDIKSWNEVFLSKEKAQAYCDWLNKGRENNE